MRDYYPFPEVKAFTSKKKARKYVKKRTGKEMTFDDVPAQCTIIEHRESRAVLCVVVLMECDDMNLRQKMTILAHECVHVVKAWLDMMEAYKPDEETVAYGVQSAMDACIEQIGEEWFTGAK